MSWKKDLEAHLKTTRKIRTALVIAGVLITVVGTVKVLINFEYEYLETFGVFPSKTDPLVLLYLTLHYLLWGVALVLIGFTVERLLNFQSAGAFIWSLTLLPFTYGVLRFVLAMLLNLSPYLAYSDLIKYFLVTVVLIAMLLLARYIVRKMEVPTVNE